MGEPSPVVSALGTLSLRAGASTRVWLRSLYLTRFGVYGPSHGLAERTYSNRPISRCYRYGRRYDLKRSRTHYSGDGR